MKIKSMETTKDSSKIRKKADLVGALTANVYMALVIVIFIVRIMSRPEIGRWIGFASTLILFPLCYLFLAGLKVERRKIYFVWLSLMLLFVLFELVVDHILGFDFRSKELVLIPYVMFFFAATGGMIGVAAQAGRKWSILTSIVFILMGVLAFIQRSITGY